MNCLAEVLNLWSCLIIALFIILFLPALTKIVVGIIVFLYAILNGVWSALRGWFLYFVTERKNRQAEKMKKAALKKVAGTSPVARYEYWANYKINAKPSKSSIKANIPILLVHCRGGKMLIGLHPCQPSDAVSGILGHRDILIDEKTSTLKVIILDGERYSIKESAFASEWRKRIRSYGDNFRLDIFDYYVSGRIIRGMGSVVLTFPISREVHEGTDSNDLVEKELREVKKIYDEITQDFRDKKNKKEFKRTNLP